jgi:DNA-binding transcriptional LysR family regulator
VFQDVRDTVGAITDHSRALTGTLRLAGGMTVCLYVFPPLLQHLKRVHPQLDIRITVATAARSADEIKSGRHDAGLLTLPVEESDLETVPVLREELLLLTTPTHRLARKKRVAPEDLANEPFVLFEPGSATRRVIDSFFVTEKIKPTVVMETENVEIIKAMVATGLGISIVPYQAVAREVRAGQFFCSRIEGQQLERETGWVYARANRVPRMVHELQVALEQIKSKLELAPRQGISRIA